MRKYDYYSDWEKYAYPIENEAAFDEDIKEKYRRVDLNADRFAASGIPLLKDDIYVYVNDLTENTLIYGETGCKKTRCTIGPLIFMTLGAGESAIVTDVKGELSANRKIRRFLESKGVRIVYIDFRSFDKDSYSILEHPFRLYAAGEKHKALTEVSRLLAAMSSEYKHDDEPIWHEQAVSYLSAVIELMFIVGIKSGCPEYVNMLTLAGFSNMSAISGLAKMIEGHIGFYSSTMTPENFAALMNIVNNPADKMIGSISGFVHSIIKPFAAEPALSEMLSYSSFSIEDIYRKPTCVFLIIPDETSAYDTVSGLLIDTFYARLIEAYGKKYMGKKEPPCRVNFICDEFCNMHINDMRSKISASRSRSMRWYLVCQSKAQLEAEYSGEAATITGNCRNMLFLQSCDTNLVNYFCDLCGESYVSETGSPCRLIRPEVLRGLRKERDFKEALFIEGNTVYFAELPDIDSYEFLNAYADRNDSEKRVRRRKKGPNFEILTLEAVAYLVQRWENGVRTCYYDDEDEDIEYEEFEDEDGNTVFLDIDPDLMFSDPDDTDGE